MIPDTHTAFSFPQRLRRCIDAWGSLRPIPRAVLVDAIGWSATLLLLALFTAAGTKSDLLFGLHFIFLYRFSRRVWERLQPPYEILLLLFYLVILLDGWLIRLIGKGTPGGLSTFWHVIFIGWLGFVLSLQIVTNGEGKRRQLFWFTFLLLLAEHFIPTPRPLLYYIFAAILFVSLLQQTRWLQHLTRQECFLYFPLFLLSYFHLSGWPRSQLVMLPNFGDPVLWKTMPMFFFLILQLQMLAVAAKIPVVLVYNHARLSRKLWISGLFQSTFPQFMQFVLLMLLFYFLIAGWQANQLRWMLSEPPPIQALSGRGADRAIVLHRVPGDTTLTLPGYEPLILSRPLPAEGIVRLDPIGEAAQNNSPRLFLFWNMPDTSGMTFRLLPLDQDYLQTVTQRHVPLIGNRLISHYYFPGRWENWLYQLDFLAPPDEIRIFPFWMINVVSHPLFNVAYPQSVESDQPYANIEIHHGPFLIFGRVLAPLYNFELRSVGYIAFDIAFFPDPGFFQSPIFRLVLVLLGLYLLLNFFIIRRVAKLGAEINSMIVQKFNQLRRGVMQIARGDLDYQIRLEGQDEFVELAHHFNRLGRELKKNIEEAREKERLEQELKIARDVQLGLLPKSLPDIPGFDIAATLQTANEVGGDFYDLLPVGKKTFLITLGDVSGKSTSAAFYMAQCISLLRFAPEFSTDLLEIVKRLNRYFTDPRVDRQIFVTAILGLLHSQTGMFHLIRAGHTPPLILSPTQKPVVREVPAAGTGIGIIPNEAVFEKSFQTVSLRLEPGETLFMYSDGLIEASRPVSSADSPAPPDAIVFYTEERLKTLLSGLATRPAAAIVETVLRDLHDFYQGHPLTDDVSLVVIQRKKQ